MGYDTDQLALAERQAAAELAEENARGITAVLRALPSIPRNQAVVGILKAYTYPAPVTLDAILWALQPGNSTLASELGLQNEPETRARLIDEIVAHAPAAERSHLQKNLMVELRIPYNKKPVPLHTTATLAKRVDNIAIRKELEQKSPSELKAIVKTQFPRPTVPVPPATLTRKAFKLMATQQQRHCINFYGADGLNKHFESQD